MSCQNIFLFTFLQCHGKVTFFETKMRVFIENKVKSCKTEGWRPSVQWLQIVSALLAFLYSKLFISLDNLFERDCRPAFQPPKVSTISSNVSSSHGSQAQDVSSTLNTATNKTVKKTSSIDSPGARKLIRTPTQVSFYIILDDFSDK